MPELGITDEEFRRFMHDNDEDPKKTMEKNGFGLGLEEAIGLHMDEYRIWLRDKYEKGDVVHDDPPQLAEASLQVLVNKYADLEKWQRVIHSLSRAERLTVIDACGDGSACDFGDFQPVSSIISFKKIWMKQFLSARAVSQRRSQGLQGMS